MGPAMEKAVKNFKERTDEPLGQEIENSNFVFVTPYVWSGKAEWIEDKVIKGSKWKIYGYMMERAWYNG